MLPVRNCSRKNRGNKRKHAFPLQRQGEEISSSKSFCCVLAKFISILKHAINSYRTLSTTLLAFFIYDSERDLRLSSLATEENCIFFTASTHVTDVFIWSSSNEAGKVFRFTIIFSPTLVSQIIAEEVLSVLAFPKITIDGLICCLKPQEKLSNSVLLHSSPIFFYHQCWF